MAKRRRSTTEFGVEQKDWSKEGETSTELKDRTQENVAPKYEGLSASALFLGVLIERTASPAVSNDGKRVGKPLVLENRISALRVSFKPTAVPNAAVSLSFPRLSLPRPGLPIHE
jgi:hypothetical protein